MYTILVGAIYKSNVAMTKLLAPDSRKLKSSVANHRESCWCASYKKSHQSSATSIHREKDEWPLSSMQVVVLDILRTFVTTIYFVG